jgi:hypothetical protein
MNWGVFREANRGSYIAVAAPGDNGASYLGRKGSVLAWWSDLLAVGKQSLHVEVASTRSLQSRQTFVRRISSIPVGLIIVAILFGSALLAMGIARFLPENHLSAKNRSSRRAFNNWNRSAETIRVVRDRIDDCKQPPCRT